MNTTDGKETTMQAKRATMEWLGKTCRYNGKRYRIVDVHPLQQRAFLMSVGWVDAALCDRVRG